MKTVKINSSLFASFISVAFISGLFLLSNVQKSYGQTVYCSNCGNWWTQLVQDATQAQNQINTSLTQVNTLATSVSNAENIANQEGGNLTNLVKPISSEIANLQTAYNNIQSLGSQATTIASNIQNLPNIPADAAQNVQSIANSLTGLRTNLLNQIQAALQSNGVAMQSGQNLAQSLQTALNAGASATGTVNALDATDQILALEEQQLSSLNKTMAQLSSIMETYQAQQEALSVQQSNTAQAAQQNNNSNQTNYIPPNAASELTGMTGY